MSDLKKLPFTCDADGPENCAFRAESGLKERLKEIASKKHPRRDSVIGIFEWFGSNVDDAYYGGKQDGRYDLAKHLLKEFFNEETS